MATTGTRITKQTIVDDFISFIKNPAYDAVVFWNGDNLGSTRMKVELLGPRDFFDTLETTDITGTSIQVTAIVNKVKQFAKYTTVVRRARSGFIVDNFSPDTVETTTDDRTDLCRLTDAYQLSYSYTAQLSGKIEASTLNKFYEAIRTTASRAQTTADVVDLRVCHTSCHSACHGSRGRR